MSAFGIAVGTYAIVANKKAAPFAGFVGFLEGTLKTSPTSGMWFGPHA